MPRRYDAQTRATAVRRAGSAHVAEPPASVSITVVMDDPGLQACARSLTVLGDTFTNGVQVESPTFEPFGEPGGRHLLADEAGHQLAEIGGDDPSSGIASSGWSRCGRPLR